MAKRMKKLVSGITNFNELEDPSESSVPRFATSQWPTFEDNSRVPSFSQVDTIQLPQNAVEAATTTLKEFQLQSLHENMQVRKAKAAKLSKTKFEARAKAKAEPSQNEIHVNIWHPSKTEGSRGHIELPPIKPMKNDPRLQGTAAATLPTQTQSSRPTQTLAIAFGSPPNPTYHSPYLQTTAPPNEVSSQQKRSSLLPRNSRPFSSIDQNTSRPRDLKHALEGPASSSRRWRQKTNHGHKDLDDTVTAGVGYNSFWSQPRASTSVTGPRVSIPNITVQPPRPDKGTTLIDPVLHNESSKMHSAASVPQYGAPSMHDIPHEDTVTSPVQPTRPTYPSENSIILHRPGRPSGVRLNEGPALLQLKFLDQQRSQINSPDEQLSELSYNPPAFI